MTRHAGATSSVTAPSPHPHPPDTRKATSPAASNSAFGPVLLTNDACEPKTGPRVVPIPAVLVTMLRKWLTDNALVQPEALLFRTSGGKRPQQSNWIRSWHRALISIGRPTLRVYDCRHAAATTWLRSGLPLGETGRRLGHSVETLVSTYAGALENEEAVGNTKIDRFLSGEGDE